jgi:NAD(P)-dependent dehydrogenase (short-subunit alcohol dehydrogenase family)
MPTGIITGASRGLGLALALALSRDGWELVIDARGAGALDDAARELGRGVTAIAGDVADPAHRRTLADAAGPRIDLLVNNAGALGPSPLPALADLDVNALARLMLVNTLAPLALTQLVLPRMPDGGVVLNVTSDAAVWPYEGWGAYGSSKAALDQLSAVLGQEHPRLKVYAVDPGDMRTQMHQDAFPGEDISDRPPPEDSVPGLLALIDGREPSGRYRAADVAAINA